MVDYTKKTFLPPYSRPNNSIKIEHLLYSLYTVFPYTSLVHSEATPIFSSVQKSKSPMFLRGRDLGDSRPLLYYNAQVRDKLT